MSPPPLLLLGLLLGCAPLSAATAPGIYNVRDTGAVGDGRQLETVAINQAIDACAKAGGGTVYVPPGRYLTGTIVLQSHVTLELDAGATILGSENPDDYPSTKSVWGDDTEVMAPLIYATDAENITITGRGTIDGQGAIWWRRVGLICPGSSRRVRRPRTILRRQRNCRAAGRISSVPYAARMSSSRG